MRLQTSPDMRGTLPTEDFPNTLAAIAEANPDYRLVGSLGRAVLYNDYFNDPYFEYDLRGERPLRTSGYTARDMDLLNAPNTPAIETPYPLDTVWADNPESAVTQTVNGEWRLQSVRYNFDELLEPETMAPVRGYTVYEVPAVTVRPQTHLALFAVRGALRRKDEIPVGIISTLSQMDTAARLPESYYDPFYELADMQRRGVMAQLTRLYRRHASEAVMRITGPALTGLKNRQLR